MKFFYYILFLILISACQLFQSTETLTISMPGKIPEILQNTDFYWLLKYRSFEGSLYTEQLGSEVKFISVTVEKGISAPLSLWAIVEVYDSQSLEVYPAGFIYCINDNPTAESSFQWDWGFEAQILLDMSFYINLERINITRLLSTIKDTAEEKNHWIIDRESLLENIVSGDFSLYDIRKKRLRNLELYLPEGYWYNVNSLGHNLFSISESVPVYADVYEGFSSFFNKNGFILEIELKSDGGFDYIIY